MAKADTHTIYALALQGRVMYVGQAKNINKRYSQHCSLAQNRGNTKVKQWLTRLAESGAKPELIIIEETNEPDIREIHWIKHYRATNSDLLNMADGGQTMGHLRRAKQTNPWGKSHSPVQRRLLGIKRTIKMYERMGDKRSKHLKLRLIEVNQAIKKVGLKTMNERLWRKYGW